MARLLRRNATVTSSQVVDLTVADDLTVTDSLTVNGAFTSVGIDDNASGATSITIDSSERVGINVASPSSQLHVQNSNDGTQNAIMLNNDNGRANFHVSQNGDGSANLELKADDGSSTTAKVHLDSDGDSEIKGGGLEVLGLVARDTLPSNDQAYDLGHSGGRWRDAYIRDGVTEGSDRDLKRDIETSDLGIDFINKLKPVSYKWKDIPAILYGEDDLEGGSKQGDIKVQEQIHKRTHYGLIAQDVKTTLDELGIDTVDFAGYGDGKAKLDADGNKIGEDGDCALRYTEFISPLIKAIQELSAKNDALEARVTALEA